ncbi:MAG: amidohydrolase [Firmicutes bacterium]|nr:amidohydrolase [Bacillota bacterium]
MKKLITNCSVLLRRGPADYTVITDARVGIDGDTICCVEWFEGKLESACTAEGCCAEGGCSAQDNCCAGSGYDQVIDAGGALVMPGLVNAHGHAAMTLLRCVGGGLPLQRWLEEAIFPVEAVLKPEDVAAGTEMAMLEMLSTGTTCFSEMYDFPDADFEAIRRSGMRANVSRVGLCFDPELDPEDWPRTRECVEFVDTHRDPADRVRAEFCFHSEYLTTERFVRALQPEIAVRPGVTLNIHLSETAKEHEECIGRHGLTPAEYFEKLGVLGPNCLLAHCVWVEDSDLEIIARTGASMIHNPSSNMKLGSGFAPVAQALDMGINVALGTDGTASNDDLDMFEEMRLAALIHKGEENDPTLLSAGQLLDMATVNGAKAMGRPDTGAVAPCMKADLILLDLSGPHMQGPWLAEGGALPPEALVYCAKGSDVLMTMVGGDVLYDRGRFLTIDRDRVYADFAASLRGIAERMKER